MKYKTEQETDNVDTYEYTADFMTLSSMEKRFIYETAEKLTKIQSENSTMLADALIPQKKIGLAVCYKAEK
jgi:hypothetical protein